jgi:small-conductance mechanosensitive channel
MLRRMIRAPFRWLLAALLLLAPCARAGEPDLATPRRALRLFIDSSRAGQFDQAARVLDLRALPEPQRAREGPRLARQLKFVLDQKLWIDWDKISDAPEGAPNNRGIELVGAIPIGADRVAVRLVRSADGSWQIGPGVVAAIPRLYRQFGPGWLGDRIPPWLVETIFLDIEGWQWLGLVAGLALALFSALVLGAVARRVAFRLARRTRFRWDDQLVEAASGPGRLLLGVATMGASVRALHLAVPAQEVMDHLLRMSSVILFTWAGLRAVRFAAEVLGERISEEGDGPAARTRLTQIMVLRRIAGFVVMVVGGALVLLQFDALRALGTSLLASAGVAGIVIGFAAQRSIATLLAGLQISMTQPVRVGDVVVIEGEWGTIEEITLTYVVVKIWDLRRLVVPMTKILDSPFQNWTRAGSDILGTVFLHADYRAPVDEVRRELERFVKGRPEWDGKVVGVQVTDATERTIEVRALVSSADSSLNWDLRCAVREHLLGFLQHLDGGTYLPRLRIDPPARRPHQDVASRPGAPSPSAGDGS